MISKESYIRTIKAKYPDLMINKCTFIDQAQSLTPRARFYVSTFAL